MDETGAIIAAERRQGLIPRIDASTCALWCAIAIGALVKGSPPESVSIILVVGEYIRRMRFLYACTFVRL